MYEGSAKSDTGAVHFLCRWNNVRIHVNQANRIIFFVYITIELYCVVDMDGDIVLLI